MSAAEGPLIFSLKADQAFAVAVAGRLGLQPSPHEERVFEDGEHKTRSLVPVRGRDVYVVQGLHADPDMSGDAKLVRLLFFVGALRDAAAARVTVIAPYLSFQRKDRQTKPRDPVATRYLAALFEAVGTDVVVTVEAHNVAAFQNAFRCDTEHLDADALTVDRVAALVGDDPAAVVSPDAGGIKRAERFRERLEARLGREVGKALCEKHRSGGVISGSLFAGDVAGRVAIVVDDMISTGTTLARAAVACRAHGARRVLAVATHGLFVGGGGGLFADDALERVVVTNSVPPFRLAPEYRTKVDVVDIAPLVAETVRRCHEGGSIVDLLETGPGR